MMRPHVLPACTCLCSTRSDEFMLGVDCKVVGSVTLVPSWQRLRCTQKRPAEFEAEAAPRPAPGARASSEQPTVQPQQPSNPGAARRDPSSAGMRPPKTGVPQRDKMRELLRDALALALDDVPDGNPGARL